MFNQKCKSAILLAVFILFNPANPAIADFSCMQNLEVKLIETKNATAGNWANLRNLEGSLKFESKRLLSKGYDLLDSKNSTEKVNVLLLESNPNKFLVSYADREYCEAKLIETKQSPIVFPDLSFEGKEKLISWFADFSRGSGKEGKKLYELCDKSCSPRYVLSISKANDNLLVDALALCGPARDKDDDTYTLKIASSPIKCK